MRYSVAFLVMMLCCLSCKEEEQPHLSREEMMKVLQDVHLAEVYSTMVDFGEERTTNKNLDSLAKYYNVVFQAHGITQEEFNASAEWYAQHPNELDSVYTKMVTSLNELDGMMSNKNMKLEK